MSARRRPPKAGSAPRIEVAWAAGPPLLADAEVERIVRAALAHGGRPDVGLAVSFGGEELLAELHGRHLGDPTPTDVLAFDLGEEGRGPVGEIFVGVDQARAEAERRGVDVRRELSLYVIHGALHLCGYDDRDPASRRRMRAAERAVLLALGRATDRRSGGE
ncbi:MAG: rRNA maturation RNase YbeY [Planctomycetota bacterium]